MNHRPTIWIVPDRRCPTCRMVLAWRRANRRLARRIAFPLFIAVQAPARHAHVLRTVDPRCQAQAAAS